MHVVDSGIGFDPQETSSIFTKFGRLQNSSKREGIGLGLTISKQIVELAGGTISASTRGPDLGSTFIFTMKMEVAPQHDDGGMA